MSDITNKRNVFETPEAKVLSYLVHFAKCAKYVVEQINLTEEEFSSSACAAAFCALMVERNEDGAVRLGVAQKHMPELNNDRSLDYFNGLAQSKDTLVADFRDFVEEIADRESTRRMNDVNCRALSFMDKMHARQTIDDEIGEKLKDRCNTLSTIKFPSEDGDAPADTPAQKVSASAYAIDESLLSVPGFVDEFVKFTMGSAHRPNKVLAFVGALAFLAHLSGRKFLGPRDACPNLYLVALADSATGKDHPRKVIKKLASSVYLANTVIQSVASGQGLEDALAGIPTLLCMFDEFDSVLRELKNDRNGLSANESLWRTLLNVFTTSSSRYTTRVKAAGANRQNGGVEIDRPSFSILATAIPSRFYSELSQRALVGGLLGRSLVFEAGPRGEENMNAGLEGREVPFMLLRRVEDIANRPPRQGDRGDAKPVKFDYGQGAVAAAAKVSKEADALYNESSDDDMAKSVWGRSSELVGKLSLLYAISEMEVGATSHTISPEAVEWAWRLVRAAQERMLQMANDYASEGVKDEKVLAALRLIKKAGKNGIMRQNLLKNLHVDKAELDRIIETLHERDEINVRNSVGVNGKGTLYIIKANKSNKNKEG